MMDLVGMGEDTGGNQ